MDHRRIQQSLRLVGKVYRPILGSTSQEIIYNAVEKVQVSWERYEKAKKRTGKNSVSSLIPWGYEIHHDSPLEFGISPIKSIDLKVDVYCKLHWTEDDMPADQDVKVRVWSTDPSLIFRTAFDSSHIESELTSPSRTMSGRVVSRFHFDKADTQQRQGPKYHMQVGGKSEDYELCWHPSSVTVPRIPHHPMDLFLTCQMVAANFFPDAYQDIRESAEWRQELLLCQRHFLLSHYEMCLRTLKNNESLLDALWVD